MGLVALMVVLSLGSVMTILDTTIVNVALGTLTRSLSLSLAEAEWVNTAYLLTLAFVVPLGGWLSARFGTKRVWIWAVALFMIGSILSGLAWTPGTLIAFRVIQGVGGGLVMPVGQSIIVRSVPGERLGRTMGFMTMPLLLGPVLGPIVGGAIVDAVSWRWIFFLNVPIGLVTLLLATRILPSVSLGARPRLDVRGLLLLPSGLVLIVYALTRVSAAGGDVHAAAVVPAVCGAVLIALFVWHASGRGAAALVDISLFRQVEFRAAAVIAFLFGLLMFGALFLLPLYFQLVRSESPFEAGLLIAPQGIGSALVLPFAGGLSDRFGAGRVVPAGLLVATLAGLVFVRADETTSYVTLALAGLARGIGLSAVMVPAYAAAYGRLDRAAVPGATSTMNVFNRVGGSMGLAVVAAILGHGLYGLLPSAGLDGGLRAVATLDSASREALAAQLATVFSHAYLVLLGFTLLSFVPAWFLPRKAIRASRRPVRPTP
jgi:EmrB/QacA subfamily drug resistance transporter